MTDEGPIRVDGDRVIIEADRLEVRVRSFVVQADQVEIRSNGAVSITGGGTVTVKGSATLQLAGAVVKLN